MSEGRKRVVEYVCQHNVTLHLALYGGTIGLLLNVGILLLLEPNTASYTVALLNLPGLMIVILVAGITLRECNSVTY